MRRRLTKQEREVLKRNKAFYEEMERKYFPKQKKQKREKSVRNSGKLWAAVTGVMSIVVCVTLCCVYLLPRKAVDEPKYLSFSEAPQVSDLDELNSILESVIVNRADWVAKFLEETEEKYYKYSFKTSMSNVVIGEQALFEIQVVLNDQYNGIQLSFEDAKTIDFGGLQLLYSVEQSQSQGFRTLAYGYLSASDERYYIIYEAIGVYAYPDFIRDLEQVISVVGAPEEPPSYGSFDDETPVLATLEDLNANLRYTQVLAAELINMYSDDVGNPHKFVWQYNLNDGVSPVSISATIVTVVNSEYHDADYPFDDTAEITEYCGYPLKLELVRNVQDGILIMVNAHAEWTTPYERHIISFDFLSIGVEADFPGFLSTIFSMKTE